VKNRGAALEDAATSILAGSQWGGDFVLSVGAWRPHGGATAFDHIACPTPAAVRGVPGRSGRHDLIGWPVYPKNPRLGATPARYYLGLLNWQPVMVVWTAQHGKRRIISTRKADAREEAAFWERYGQG
jgi:hypothetical protein